MKNTKQIQIRNMPPKIHDYLVDKQAEIRKKSGKFISLERVIYQLITVVIENEIKNKL